MDDWYVTQITKVSGPYSASDIVRLTRECKLTPTSMVRRGRNGKWVPLSLVRDSVAAQAISESRIVTHQTAPGPSSPADGLIVPLENDVPRNPGFGSDKRKTLLLTSLMIVCSILILALIAFLLWIFWPSTDANESGDEVQSQAQSSFEGSQESQGSGKNGSSESSEGSSGDQGISSEDKSSTRSENGNGKERTAFSEASAKPKVQSEGQGGSGLFSQGGRDSVSRTSKGSGHGNEGQALKSNGDTGPTKNPDLHINSQLTEQNPENPQGSRRISEDFLPERSKRNKPDPD
ncbi:hypothetical protein GC170_22465 [bacterium]|nr:hypothetical protein [bacterium]